jgi:hypothetical protein
MGNPFDVTGDWIMNNANAALATCVWCGASFLRGLVFKRPTYARDTNRLAGPCCPGGAIGVRFAHPAPFLFVEPQRVDGNTVSLRG